MNQEAKKDSNDEETFADSMKLTYSNIASKLHFNKEKVIEKFLSVDNWPLRIVWDKNSYVLYTEESLKQKIKYYVENYKQFYKETDDFFHTCTIKAKFNFELIFIEGYKNNQPQLVDTHSIITDSHRNDLNIKLSRYIIGLFEKLGFKKLLFKAKFDVRNDNTYELSIKYYDLLKIPMPVAEVVEE